jgi:hypothetical protein
MTLLRWSGCFALALGQVGCGTSSDAGGSEPFRVEGAQFVEGVLPTVNDADETLPRVTSPVTSTLALRERLRGVGFSGSATDDTLSVGVQFEGQGGGYWLLPTGSRDATNVDSLLYSFSADFQEALAPGRHTLLVVGFGKGGKAGPATRTDFCIRSLRPDNGNACFPEISPPALVISLEWDQAVDLDLAVTAPDGQIVNSKSPTLLGAEGSSAPLARLVADGNADCHFDGLQREDVVFNELPPGGNYSVYVSLARACSEESVRYSAAFSARVTEEDGTYRVRTRPLGGGILTRAQVSLSGNLGTFVSEVQVK